MVDKFARLSELLAPLRCRLCGADCGRLQLCAACFDALPWNRNCCPHCALPQTHASPCPRCLRRTPPFASIWVPLRHEAPVQNAIHALKYQAGFAEGVWLARLFAASLGARTTPLPELLVPVPLHWRRLCRRGYNQSAELARTLGRETGIAVAVDAGRRLRATADQIGTRAAQRRRNVRGAFACDARVAGRRIVLLDDVMTTGATLSELARAAHRAGALEVEAWAIARVA